MTESRRGGKRALGESAEGDDLRLVEVLPDLPAVQRTFTYRLPISLVVPELAVGSLVIVPLHGRRVKGWVVDTDPGRPPGVALAEVIRWRGIGPDAEVVGLCRWAAWRWAGPVAHLLTAATGPRLVSRLPPPGPGWSERVGDEGRRLARGGSSLERAAVSKALDCRYGVLRLPPGIDPLPSLLEMLAAVAGDGESPLRTSALVLHPTLRGATALASRLSRIGIPVATWPEGWAEAASGGRVVLGSRGAVLASVRRLGLIVVLDAHDDAYKEERSPTWDAWRVAVQRARSAGIPCVLVSPCPSVEQSVELPIVPLPRAGERSGWAPVEVVDLREADPREGLLTGTLLRVLRGALAESTAEVPALVVHNRVGAARLLGCAACGELARCEYCGAVLRQDSTVPWQGGSGVAKDVLACPSCGMVRPAVCQACGSLRFRVLRSGAERLAKELSSLLGEPVDLVMGPAGGGPGGGRPERGRPGAGGPEAGGSERDGGDDGGRDTSTKARALLGTEALLYRTPRASVVVFADLDEDLFAPRFTAGEHAIALVALAARRVAFRRGRIVVQTRVPAHAVVRAIRSGDPEIALHGEESERRETRMPPFRALARISGSGSSDAVARWRESGACVDLDVVELPAGRGAPGWLVLAESHELLCNRLERLPRGPGRVRVEVDPRM